MSSGYILIWVIPFRDSQCYYQYLPHTNVINAHPSGILLKQNNIRCSALSDSTYKAAPPKAMLFYIVHIPSRNNYAKSLNLSCEIQGPCCSYHSIAGHKTAWGHSQRIIFSSKTHETSRSRELPEYMSPTFSETMIMIKFPSSTSRDTQKVLSKTSVLNVG